MTKDGLFKEAVESATYQWVSDHPNSSWQCMVEGFENAFKKWLDENTESVIQVIARRMTEYEMACLHDDLVSKRMWNKEPKE